MKAYVHIGLPKTATTTLQADLFEPGDGIYWEYLGVLQPRHRKQAAKYLDLMAVLSDNTKLSSDSVRLLRTELSSNYSDLPLLMSEECITTDGGTSWQEKLSRLSVILNGFEVKLIVSVRRPREALYSLYAELYSSLASKYPNFDDYVNDSNQAKIYRYKELFDVLTSHFHADALIVIPFEELGSDRFWSPLESEFCLEREKFSFGEHNAKTRSNGAYILPNATIGSAIHRRIAGPVCKNLSRGGLLYRGLRELYQRSGARSWSTSIGKKSIVVPRPQLGASASKIIDESEAWITEKFGLDW